jgi:hypothetical protein
MSYLNKSSCECKSYNECKSAAVITFEGFYIGIEEEAPKLREFVIFFNFSLLITVFYTIS